MDVETYCDAPGRGESIERVRAKIDELGIDFIYYQYISITGRVMGKAAPAPHWETMAAKGVQTWYGGLTNVLPDRAGNLLGFPPNAHELVAIPDPDTFCRLPWNKRAARVFCTVFHGREEDENPGGFMEEDCRGNLRRVHARFGDDHDGLGDDHDGLHMRHGCEPEMAWLNKGPDGMPRRRADQAAGLPYRPVRGALPRLHEGDRLRPGHGPRHDPGRPRGRAGPVGAQLHLRRRAQDLRPAHDLPPDLRPGRARGGG